MLDIEKEEEYKNFENRDQMMNKKIYVEVDLSILSRSCVFRTPFSFEEDKELFNSLIAFVKSCKITKQPWREIRNMIKTPINRTNKQLKHRLFQWKQSNQNLGSFFLEHITCVLQNKIEIVHRNCQILQNIDQ